MARADVPPLLVKTLLLAEDSAFFSHRGLDLSELPKAIGAHWADGGTLRGASTITQQLAKNLFLSPERSLKRKLQELALAFLLESTLGKDRILEIYLNVIEWGPGLYGLRPAARHYFGKEPRALTPKEMAFLVVADSVARQVPALVHRGDAEPGPRAARREPARQAPLGRCALRGRVRVRSRRDARIPPPRAAGASPRAPSVPGAPG